MPTIHWGPRLFAACVLSLMFSSTLAEQRISNQTVKLGSGAGADVTEIIDGSGESPGGWTSWLIHPILDIGHNGGKGTLKVINGGYVEVDTPLVGWSSINIGNKPTNTGIMIVDGEDSYVSATSFLMVGHSGGTGFMAILNGGTVTSGYTRVAYSYADGVAHGDVLVAGTGSSWVINGRATIGIGSHGGKGFGKLRIRDGGQVACISGYMGFDVSGYGEALVSGLGSAWINDEYLIVGGRSEGTLLIENGGVVENTYAEMAQYSTATESWATVTGVGSRWTCRDSLYVAGQRDEPGGASALNIFDDATVSVAELIKLYPGATVNLNGGRIEANRIEMDAGSSFHFDEGRLTFDTFDGDLVNTHGTVAPGFATDGATIDGDYVQEHGGTLEINVTSPEALDVLQVNGDASLSGTIRFIFERSPREAGVYEFMQADAINIGWVGYEAINLRSNATLLPDFEAGRFYIVPGQICFDVHKTILVMAGQYPEAVYLKGVMNRLAPFDMAKDEVEFNFLVDFESRWSYVVPAGGFTPSIQSEDLYEFNDGQIYVWLKPSTGEFELSGMTPDEIPRISPQLLVEVKFGLNRAVEQVFLNSGPGYKYYIDSDPDACSSDENP